MTDIDESDAFPIQTIEGIPLDQRQAIAYQEWKRLSAEGHTPRQRDFRPDRIARALPAASLMHVTRTDNAIRLTQRLEGRFVVLAFGEGAGNDIEHIYNDDHLHAMMPRYLESAMTGDAAMTTCTAPREDGSAFEFNRLILPFANAEGVVNRLLVVFYFDPVTLARLPGPLKVRRETRLDLITNAATIIGGGLQTRQAG